MSKPGPFYDGKVHVLSERCSTCIFRPGNPMHLRPGRVKEMVEESVAADAAITCHQTLPYNETGALPAICRGFYDAHGDRVSTLQIAQRLDFIVEVDPPTKGHS